MIPRRRGGGEMSEIHKIYPWLSLKLNFKGVPWSWVVQSHSEQTVLSPYYVHTCTDKASSTEAVVLKMDGWMSYNI